MNPRQLVLAAVLVGATTVPACAYIGGVAHAQAPGCGGNKTTYPAPIDCQNTTTVDGITRSVRLVVDDTGYVMVTATIAAPPGVDPGPMFLQVKAHPGISSDTGGVYVTDVFDGNTASLELNMPRSLADECKSQIDVKVVPGQPTTAHVSPNYRVAAPLVGIDLAYCQPATTTTTVPDTTPTTAPASSPTTTAPTASTSPASSVSTTTAPTVTSVVGGTLPATGPTADLVGYGIVLLFTGAFLVIYIYARKHPAS